MDIREYLEHNLLIMDGAMGTYYDSLSMTGSEVAELGNWKHPERILAIHKEYIRSGARLIRTNTFAANHALFPQEEDLKEAILQAVRIANQAALEAEDQVWVAASIGPVPAVEEEDTDQTRREYERICDYFLQAGCRIFIFETFSSLEEVRKAAAYLKEKVDTFIVVQFICNSMGYTKDGISARRLVEGAANADELDAYGFNCGIGAAHLYKLLRNMHFPNKKYVTALPNSGYPQIVRGRTVYTDSPDYFAEKMASVAGIGVNMLGGCCGTTPEYIRQLAEQVKGLEPAPKRIHPKLESVKTELDQTEAENPFMNKLRQGDKVIAVELDPPYDQQADKLMDGCYALKQKQVDMITIADSPLAKSRADSIHMAMKVFHEFGVAVMPHVCCRDKNKIAMRSQLLGAHINGLQNLLLITGDPILRGDKDSIKGVFDFNSIRLMQFVREMNREHFAAAPFYYGGALNYNGANLDAIVERMKRKVEAGCSYFLTQPVYSREDIERIYEIKKRIDTKILCGIMPLVSYKNASFIRNEMPGIHVPDAIMEQYREGMSREEAEQVAVRVSVQVAGELWDAADGFYLMTPFNRVSLIGKVVDAIREWN